MAEPLAYQLLQRAQASLAAIVGDGGASYWYTPAGVFIVGTYVDPRLFDASATGVLYGIKLESVEHARRNTGTASQGSRDQATVQFSVIAAKAFSPSSVADVPDATLIELRMVRDILRKLAFEDAGLGVLETDDVLAAVVPPLEDVPDGWATKIVTLHAVYDYFASAP